MQIVSYRMNPVDVCYQQEKLLVKKTNKKLDSLLLGEVKSPLLVKERAFFQSGSERDAPLLPLSSHVL